MEQFDQFARDNGIALSVRPIPTRTGDGRDSEWDKQASHFHMVLTMGEGPKARTLWAGEYSQGIGNAESWAKKNKSKFMGLSVTPGHGWSMREALEHGPGRGKAFRPDSHYWHHIRQRYGEAVAKPDQKIITPGEILLSLQLDIMSCDQPFADWAGDLGYSDDSISAKAIWEACNDIRRALQAAFNSEQYETFLNLEE